MKFLLDLVQSEKALAKKNVQLYEQEYRKFASNLKGIDKSPYSNEEFVNCYMALAIKTVALIMVQGKKPSTEHKLQFWGDGIGIRYYWTSVIYLGSLLPDLGITPSTVENKTLIQFNEKKELGYFNLFGPLFCATSLFEVEFKNFLNEAQIKNYLIISSSNFVPEKNLEQQKLEVEISAQIRQKNLEVEKKRTIEQEALKEKERQDQHEKMERDRKQRNDNLCESVQSFDATILSVAKLLKQEGVNINYQTDDGYTSLMKGIGVGNDRVAEYLLNQGADPTLEAKDKNTAASLVSRGSPIFTLLKEKEREILLQRQSPIISLNKALHEEIKSQATQTRNIKKLLNKGASINYQDEDGFTPLMLAIEKQDDRIAEYLLNQGADPLLRNQQDEIASELASRNSFIFSMLKGYELLYATFHADLAMAKTLLDTGIDKDFQGLAGYTPLLIAVEQGYVDFVALLLSTGANLALTRKDGQGVFDLVVKQEILELLESMYELTGAEEDSEESIRIEADKKLQRFFSSGDKSALVDIKVSSKPKFAVNFASKPAEASCESSTGLPQHIQ